MPPGVIMIPTLPSTSADRPAPRPRELVSAKQKKIMYSIRKYRTQIVIEYTTNSNGFLIRLSDFNPSMKPKTIAFPLRYMRVLAIFFRNRKRRTADKRKIPRTLIKIILYVKEPANLPWSFG